jgi:hypothetical protein
MPFGSRCLPAPVLAISGAVVLGAPAAADPVYTGDSAESVVDYLHAQGYSVQINWLNGYDTVPLSYCTVENINNPGDIHPSSGKLATVYVDVNCPNHQDD